MWRKCVVLCVKRPLAVLVEADRQSSILHFDAISNYRAATFASTIFSPLPFPCPLFPTLRFRVADMVSLVVMATSKSCPICLARLADCQWLGQLADCWLCLLMITSSSSSSADLLFSQAVCTLAHTDTEAVFHFATSLLELLDNLSASRLSKLSINNLWHRKLAARQGSSLVWRRKRRRQNMNRHNSSSSTTDCGTGRTRGTATRSISQGGINSAAAADPFCTWLSGRLCRWVMVMITAAAEDGRRPCTQKHGIGQRCRLHNLWQCSGQGSSVHTYVRTSQMPLIRSASGTGRGWSSQVNRILVRKAVAHRRWFDKCTALARKVRKSVLMLTDCALK